MTGKGAVHPSQSKTRLVVSTRLDSQSDPRPVKLPAKQGSEACLPWAEIFPRGYMPCEGLHSAPPCSGAHSATSNAPDCSGTAGKPGVATNATSVRNDNQ